MQQRSNGLGAPLLRYLGPAGMALFLAAHTAPAAAQYRQETAGRVGSGTVIRIFNGNRFDRCAAHFSNPAVLRIAFNAERIYALSIPRVDPPRGAPLTLTVSAANGTRLTAPATISGDRTAAALSTATIEAMMTFRGPMIVTAGNARYQWTLGAAVEDVLRAIENCTNRATGWR